jgi:hypothetical protein
MCQRRRSVWCAIKVFASFVFSVTVCVWYFLMDFHYWGKWKRAIASGPESVFWTAHLDGTRKPIPTRPRTTPCGTGILSGVTVDTLTMDRLPINPWACLCDDIEYEGGTFPLCCKRFHATLLRYVATNLPRFQLTFWLDFGTLLGAVREGGFILHDSDVDLGLLVATVEDARNLDRFLQQAIADGFGPGSWYEREKKDVGDTKNEKGVRPWEALWTSRVGGDDMFAISAFGEHLDIFVYHPCTISGLCLRDTPTLTWNDGNGNDRFADFLQTYNEAEVRKLVVSTSHVFPLSMNCNFHGWFLPCPNNATFLLQQYFGSGTKILKIVHKHCHGGCANQENSTSASKRLETAMKCLIRTGSNSLARLAERHT